MDKHENDKTTVDENIDELKRQKILNEKLYGKRLVIDRSTSHIGSSPSIVIRHYGRY